MMDKIKLTFEEFESLAKVHKTIPVYQRILADLLTPVGAWAHLIEQTDNGFLLESVEKGTQYSRYSYLGINPKMILKNQNSKTYIKTKKGVSETNKPLIEILRKIQKEYKTAKLPGIPAFTGGLVGYLGYETITWVEDIPIHEKSEIEIPDSIFMLFEDMIVFDHLRASALVVSNVNIKDKSNSNDLRLIYDSAHKRIDTIGEALHTDLNYSTPISYPQSKLTSNFTKKDFELAVKQAKIHIREGDIFQVVLSQKFQRKTSVPPITLYRSLRTINPSPYMFHLHFKELDIIGASPELLVKVDDRSVEIRPIAGTRPRGKNDEEDKKLSKDLLSDEKELAEHLMLLDLGRNDVGKVSKFGSVSIPERMTVENYSHVMHIVSDVKGELLPEKDGFDALMSGFPAGTVTGAPKIRAMEIIHNLEPNRRDVYSGAVGFFDFTGNVNSCIAIRTMVIKDEIVYFQSGAGIVLDSDPNTEYEETVNKAKASMAAIDFAENGLV
tara:strand:+ start:10517 stop:12007 length:1491 start_codon:yes stop_codon:yes gene_type:complete